MPDIAPSPTLVVLRGNSASGKTSVAREVRRRYGRGCALVEQDHLRRIVLREHDSSHGPGIAPEFIDNTVRFALSRGYHVVLEGTLNGARYAPSLRRLIADHPGPSHVFYFDISFEETIRRHAGRPLSAEVTVEQMREWYMSGDLLDVPGELVIPETSSFEESVALVLASFQSAVPMTPCPNQCSRCQAEPAHRGS